VVVTADLTTNLEVVKDAVWGAGIQKRARVTPCTTRSPNISSKTFEHDGAENCSRDRQRRISTVWRTRRSTRRHERQVVPVQGDLSGA